jgi:hypothetical protein
MHFVRTPRRLAATCSAMLEEISRAIGLGVANPPRSGSPRRAKEAGGVASDTNRLPWHAPAIRMQEAAEVVPKAIVPASVRPLA